MRAQMFSFSSWITETDPKALFLQFSEMLKKSGFGIENVIEKHFEPFGYTALFLLSESHFAIHTFPEEKQTYIELTSCVKHPFNNFISYIYGLQ